MSDPWTLPGRLTRAFANPDRGIIGLVDELLAASLRRDVALGWRDGRCQVELSGGGPADRFEVAAPRSVARAILARLAALCNEHQPEFVSPFGGRCEVAFDTDPPKIVLVSFINTPDEQSLALKTPRHATVPADGDESPTARA